MSESKKLVWDQTGQKKYETGVEQCALYLQDDNGKYPKGVAWNGITGVSEAPSGAEPTNIYADNIKYLSLMSAEEFGATITAYMYPDEFETCIGAEEIAEGVIVAQQDHAIFGIASGYYFSLAKKNKISNQQELKTRYLFLSIFIPFILHGFYDFCLLTQNEILFLVYIVFVIALYCISINKVKKMMKMEERFVGGKKLYCSNCGMKVDTLYCPNCGKKMD